MTDFDLLSFVTDGSIDKVVGSFDILSDSISVGAATLSGGSYLPNPFSKTIVNPYGHKALLNMIWSIDGINYYPQKTFIYNPGNPVPTGLIGATCGGMVDDNYIYFMGNMYLGNAITVSIYYVLDLING